MLVHDLFVDLGLFRPPVQELLRYGYTSIITRCDVHNPAKHCSRAWNGGAQYVRNKRQATRFTDVLRKAFI